LAWGLRPQVRRRSSQLGRSAIPRSGIPPTPCRCDAFQMKEAGALLAASLVALGLLLGHTATWILHHLRLKRLAARMRTQVAQRVAERARRLAREHDDLLQAMQGLSLSLQAIAEQLAPDDPAKQRLEQILDRTDEVLAAGRRRLQDSGGRDEGSS
jgi:signal transduction histidine kinase